ncbi:MAG: ABC transporter ATP-binding protein [Nitriliruptorales bacterium]|nr:ABC transporter ATP-binding protein [Nitriliruptorales bacterium]
MTTAPGLEVVGLAVRRGQTVILRDVDLVVPAGSFVTIVGPSGAGKTTLLRSIAGLESLAAGHIRLDGRDLADVPVHRRGMAAVFQEPRLFPTMDVADNVAFPLRVRGMSRALRRRRADELLEEVGLAGFATRRIRDLSGGEARRTALARALASEPDVLLLDEPLVGVEPSRREALRRLIRRLHDERLTTTIHVTHDRVEAAELGDTTALVIEGRVWQHAQPRELFERPSSAVVARFLGASNILSGVVRDGTLQLRGGQLPVPGPDGSATVVVRPERLRLSPHGPLTGRVTATAYQGTHVRIDIDAGDRLVVHAPIDAGARVGEVVHVAPDPGAVWRLPEPGPAREASR